MTKGKTGRRQHTCTVDTSCLDTWAARDTLGRPCGPVSDGREVWTEDWTEAAQQQTVCNSGTSRQHLGAGRDRAGREPQTAIWPVPLG